MFKTLLVSLSLCGSNAALSLELGCLPSVPRMSADDVDFVSVTDANQPAGHFILTMDFGNNRLLKSDVTGSLSSSEFKFHANDERGVILSGTALGNENIDGKNVVYYDSTLHPGTAQRFICF